MPDARKSLQVLHDEWMNCTNCSLGERRRAEEGSFVFGEGVRRSIMLIGEGPGELEEKHGRPFLGKSGELLRRILEVLGVTDYYLTNVVACRSCAPRLDGEGKPIVFIPRKGPPKMRWVDEPPLPAQYAACRSRLEEEIYLVDPVVIVGLGATAAKALLHRNITITKERGDADQVLVPGASFTPTLTEKRREWFRISKGQVTDAPTEQNLVRYYFVPTLHPAYVLRKIEDKHPNSPFQQLVSDLRKAAQVYEMYMEIVHGVVPTGNSQTSSEDVYDIYNTAAQDTE